MIYCIKTSRFHEGCLMYIFLAVIAILFLIFVAVSIRAKNGSRIYKPTKRDIEKEADEKYNRISGRMQQKLLRKRKSIKTKKRTLGARKHTAPLFFVVFTVYFRKTDGIDLFLFVRAVTVCAIALTLIFYRRKTQCPRRRP